MYHGVFEESTVEEVRLPATLRRLEYSVFRKCKNLKKIRLPEGLEYIGKRCFSESCLEEIIFPPSVRVVGIKAFQYCK